MKVEFRRMWIIFLFLSTSVWTFAQEVQVQVSYDTLYIGNLLAIQFHMKDWEGEIKYADFGDFALAGGPQISSSVRVVQGERTSEKSLMYYLKSPDTPGTYTIPSQRLEGKEEEVYSDEITIVVVENPENIQQNPVIKKNDNQNRSNYGRRLPPTRGERKRF